jgi:flagellar biosynthesis/type III secretory pathway protein FliH
MSADPRDPLEALRDQLERTQEAARELAREAAEAAASARTRPPAAGYQAPGSGGAEAAGAAVGGEIAALFALVEAVREAVPPDLLERVVAVARELLLAIRALIDYVVGRLEAREPPPTEVEDIPIL